MCSPTQHKSAFVLHSGPFSSSAQVRRYLDAFINYRQIVSTPTRAARAIHGFLFGTKTTALSMNGMQ
jgi:hypothetical protein